MPNPHPCCQPSVLRLTGCQHRQLMEALYPGDGNEAVAICLCGFSRGPEQSDPRTVQLVNEVHPLPSSDYRVRQPDFLGWNTNFLPSLLDRAGRRGQLVLKIHSHPSGYSAFSATDDESDKQLFKSLGGWLDCDWPGMSAILLPDGRIIARAVDASGNTHQVDRVAVIGSNILFFDLPHANMDVPMFADRTLQMFGERTVRLLSNLTVAVVGCSGTGSPLVEMLARLGVGRLVLVDPEIVEEINLNRIYGASLQDAKEHRLKVDVLADHVLRADLGTIITRVPQSLFSPHAIRSVAQCDLVFGCLDSADGRDLLNRVATYYLLPYIDVGIGLDADGMGGVTQVCGSVNYVQPDGASLLSRGLYTPDRVAADALQREDPDEYTRRRESKYIRGAREAKPAVISVNTLFASLAVNEALGRLHPFRDDSNDSMEQIMLSLTQMRMVLEDEKEPCAALAKHAGEGDRAPLVGMPEICE